MGMAGLIALIGMVAATVAFAASDHLTGIAAMWIVAIGILTFGGVRYGQLRREHGPLKKMWERP